MSVGCVERRSGGVGAEDLVEQEGGYCFVITCKEVMQFDTKQIRMLVRPYQRGAQ